MFGVLGIGLSLYADAATPGWSPLWTVATIILTALAMVFTWPAGGVVPGSSFVKGDARGSSFDNVVTQGTETFIGGNAIGSTFKNIRFNVVSRRWPSTVALVVLALLAIGELVLIVVVSR